MVMFNPDAGMFPSSSGENPVPVPRLTFQSSQHENSEQGEPVTQSIAFTPQRCVRLVLRHIKVLLHPAVTQNQFEVAAAEAAKQITEQVRDLPNEGKHDPLAITEIFTETIRRIASLCNGTLKHR